MIDFSFSDQVDLMSEIIDSVPNATLTFQTLEDGVILGIQYSPDGNPIIPTGEYITMTLSCYLNQKTIGNSILDTPMGVDLETNYFEGRLISPKTYPMPIQSQGDILATINGQQGRVMAHRAFSSPSAINFGYEAKMGQKIALFVQFPQGVAGS